MAAGNDVKAYVFVMCSREVEIEEDKIILQLPQALSLAELSKIINMLNMLISTNVSNVHLSDLIPTVSQTEFVRMLPSSV